MSWHWITRLPSGRRTKFLALALWLVIASAVGPLAIKLADVVTDDAVAWLPRTAEATQAFERAEAAFPGSDRLVAVAVYARDTGLTDADRAKAEADRTVFTRYAEGGEVPPAIVSDDGKAILISFPLAGDEDQQADSTGEVRDQLANAPPAGLLTGLTGSAGATDDLFDAFGGMDITLVLVTAGVVALLLLFTYRSPVLWLVPLFCVGVASQVASAVVYLLAKHAGLTVDFQGQSVLTVLVFGVGVDYALLLIARYREELRRHRDRHEAMAVALRRSFPAILASAATVALALLCLLAAELNSTRSLGPVGAVGIAAAFLVMTLLLPAVLVLCGRWLFWPFVPRYSPDAVGHDVAEDHRVWGRVAAFVGRRPRAVWMGTAVALAALTLGVGNLSLGLPGGETFTKEVGSVTGQKLIAQHFAEGSAAPAEITARSAAADEVAAAVRGVEGVASVQEPERAPDGQWTMIRAVLAAEPDSAAAKDTVERMRDAVHAVPGAEALVGGETAIQLDTGVASRRDERVVIPLILAVVFLILVVLLRALVAPLVLIGSVVLSYAAAMGTAAFVLDAMGYTKLFDGLPLQAFLFLVALGVDYTIFLMTRAREEVGQLGHKRGVLHALTVTGGVITSAGLVLAATFAALSILPLVPSVQIGVIVAAGVLIDTFVIRSLLIPALSVHLGKKIWWPSRPVREPAAEASAPPLLTRV